MPAPGLCQSPQQGQWDCRHVSGSAFPQRWDKALRSAGGPCSLCLLAAALCRSWVPSGGSPGAEWGRVLSARGAPAFPLGTVQASCPAGCGDTPLTSRAASTCLAGSANPAGRPPDGQRPVIVIIARPSPRSLVRRWVRSASLPILGVRLPVPSEAEPKHLLSKCGLVRELLVTQKRKLRHGPSIFSCQ